MTLPIKKCTSNEVIHIIKNKICSSNAPGYDLITGKILKELPVKAIQLIGWIFNASLGLGYFPKNVSKPPENVSSYRPISLLPILSKVFEKIISIRLKPLLIGRKLIPEHQFGFREQHSTIEQVHRVVKEINKNMDVKKYCTAAFLDITQVFDKVWHTGLLYKLKKQLPHELYRLLKSYLENRHFYVNYQDERSKLQDIQSGIPQGSVLGPTLYLIYTADIPIAENTAMATFADDTALLAAHEDPEVASRLLQVGLHQIQNWLKLWRVRANESKSVQITFTTRKGKCPSVYLNNKPLPQVDSVKYLRIHLDKRLTWRSHIWAKRKQLCLKMRSMYWLIEKKSQLSAKNKILLYKTILKPIWTYGIQLWGTAKISNIQIIQRFQKFCEP